MMIQITGEDEDLR